MNGFLKKVFILFAVALSVVVTGAVRFGRLVGFAWRLVVAGVYVGGRFAGQL